MTEEAEPKATGEEERNLKRKQSLEAAVTLGLGYGKKKKRHIEAFYSAVWPLLEEAGWTQVSVAAVISGYNAWYSISVCYPSHQLEMHWVCSAADKLLPLIRFPW